LDCKVVVIGTGVLGLDIANDCLEYSNDIFVIEKESTFGAETSSRNSEVVRSGLYHPTN
jgi:L-2-hydroxyglutarate oxidase LhgO